MERLDTRWLIPPWVRHEHLCRYEFAATHVERKLVVDCASGEGLGAASFIDAGATRVVACDRSAVALAKINPSSQIPGLHSVCGDAGALPLASASAEVFIALETLEHLAEPQAFLVEVARILTSDGLFMCSTPNRAVTNPGSSLTDRPLNSFHVREFTPQELLELLHPLFRSVELYGQNPTREWCVRALTQLGRVSRHAAARLQQLMKAPGWVFDRPEHHAVQPLAPDDVPEYLIAVCRAPSPHPRYSGDAGGRAPVARSPAKGGTSTMGCRRRQDPPPWC